MINWTSAKVALETATDVKWFFFFLGFHIHGCDTGKQLGNYLYHQCLFQQLKPSITRSRKLCRGETIMHRPADNVDTSSDQDKTELTGDILQGLGQCRDVGG
jgi:hypothetical protein